MSQYRLKLQPKNISQPVKTVKFIALDAINAKEIALTFNKGCTVDSCVRLGHGCATGLVLSDLKDTMIESMDHHDAVNAQRCEKAFYSTVLSLKDNMNVVAFGMAKKRIPYLPPCNI